ncbi:MAG: GGDEF domain-containing protein, partial [Sulfurovum sp.]|nr:GGDEF domain-containing protein [Sulfurovum sp.]
LFLQFNLMVDEINTRDKILKAYNLDLKSLVDDTSEKLEKVSILATTDALTGLYNRRYLMDTFDTMIKSAQIKQEPLGIIMLDIDHFKSVNDSLGHNTGDLVLKVVADLLQNNARADNIVGRIGGEEFLILCPNCDTQRTFDIAQRIREKIATTVINYEEGKTTQVQVSSGIYSAIPELSKEELLKIADDALYLSKKNGRNKVTIGEIRN